jgi:hypothetical protein
VKESSALPRGVTGVAADARRVIFVSGPYGFGAPSPEGTRPLWKARASDPKIAHRFRGQLALTPDGVLYAHADGALSFVKDGAEKEEWSVPTPEFTSPLLVHEGRVWFAAATVGLLGVDLKDGRVVSKVAAADAGLFTPILWDGKPAFWSAEGWLVPIKD